MTRRHTVVGEADIRVADAAARNLNDDIVRTGGEGGEFAGLQSRVWGLQLKSIPFTHTRHGGPLRLNSRKLNKVRNRAKLGGDDHHTAV